MDSMDVSDAYIILIHNLIVSYLSPYCIGISGGLEDVEKKEEEEEEVS